MTPSYRDVMLEWSVAELMSPHWRSRETWVWANPAWESWREIVRKHGRNAWTPEQADVLIKAIEVSRKPVIDLYGPRPNSRFVQRDLTPREIGALHAMPEFFPPGGTLRQLLDWVRAKPDFAPEKTIAIAAMRHAANEAAWPFGTLIVVEQANGVRTLIEGYKRALASLAAGRAKTPTYLASA